MKIHDLSTWDEIADACRHHEDPLIALIIRRAEEVIDITEDYDAQISNDDDLDADTVDELIEEYKELAAIRDTVFEKFELGKHLSVDQIEEHLDAYVSAYDDLKEIDAVCVENLPFLTPGSLPEQLQHEFDRMKELHDDVVRQRDFYRMLAGVKP